jgi:hypothetical protein
MQLFNEGTRQGWNTKLQWELNSNTSENLETTLRESEPLWNLQRKRLSLESKAFPKLSG